MGFNQAAMAGCGGAQIWAFLTLETLLSTPSGVTSPTTVTFFAAKSMLNVLTPELRKKVSVFQRSTIQNENLH